MAKASPFFHALALIAIPSSFPYHSHDWNARIEGGTEERKEKHLLTDQKNIDGREIEIVEIGHGRHSLTASMHASIELHLGQPLLLF